MKEGEFDINTLQTPSFVLDKQELERSINSFDTSLKSCFVSHLIGYSVKTNSLPYLLSVVRDNGCYAEVVSFNEYNLALKVGFLPNHIIYNGPLKSKETFLKAIADHAIVNIETWREIEWLEEGSERFADEVEVGLRININISKVSPDDEDTSDDDSRFGFNIESGDFQKALDAIANIKNVKISGIHTHREPKTRSVSFYQNVIRYIQDAVRPISDTLRYWDLGGGFFGPMPGKPTFDDYCHGFYDVMEPWARKLTIIVEPGNAIVASAFRYVTTVIDVKHHDNKVFVTTDGTRNDIDPFFHKNDYFKNFLYKNEKSEISEYPQVVGGLSCLEYDRLFTIPPKKRLLSVGDNIIYDRVGAYTMTLTPLFIHYFPKVYMYDNGILSVIRDEWTEKEFLQKSEM